MSFLFKGTDTYLSIPGLKLWISGDNSPMTLDGSNNILSVLDISPEQDLAIAGGSGTRAPSLVASGNHNYIKSIKNGASGNVLLLPIPSQLNFMHNGSAFGQFSIVNLATTNDIAVELFHVCGISATATEVGYTCRYREDSNNWDFRIFNGAGGVEGSSLVHLVSRNVKFQPELIQHVFKGGDYVGNASEVYFNKTLASTGAKSANPFDTTAPYPNTNQLYRSSDEVIGGEGHGYLTLCYDWTGYTPEQIDSFRQRIQDLIYKQYSDILPVS